MIQEKLLLGVERVVQLPVLCFSRLVLIGTDHLAKGVAEFCSYRLHGLLEAPAYLFAYLRQFFELINAPEALQQVSCALRLRSYHDCLDECADLLVEFSHFRSNFRHALYAGIRLQRRWLKGLRVCDERALTNVYRRLDYDREPLLRANALCCLILSRIVYYSACSNVWVRNILQISAGQAQFYLGDSLHDAVHCGF